MIGPIDHVAIVTNDPQAAAEGLRLFSLKPDATDVVDSFGVACQFWRRDGGPMAIEVVTPARAGDQVSGTSSGTGLACIMWRSGWTTWTRRWPSCAARWS